eukprot:TRINITY_DN623_c0_g1_i3.p1 TRINITY_DN623_c0_g1~~TRINITY_DN623_c0_g1_i3.p1  ORF type:complete len:112 (-),score=4.21 TRINITY_DN623_c0_g1_i3:9-344(-)
MNHNTTSKPPTRTALHQTPDFILFCFLIFKNPQSTARNANSNRPHHDHVGAVYAPQVDVPVVPARREHPPACPADVQAPHRLRVRHKVACQLDARRVGHRVCRSRVCGDAC